MDIHRSLSLHTGPHRQDMEGRHRRELWDHRRQGRDRHRLVTERPRRDTAHRRLRAIIRPGSLPA